MKVNTGRSQINTQYWEEKDTKILTSFCFPSFFYEINKITMEKQLIELDKRMKDLVILQSKHKPNSKEWKIIEEGLTLTANKIYSLKFAGIKE